MPSSRVLSTPLTCRLSIQRRTSHHRQRGDLRDAGLVELARCAPAGSGALPWQVGQASSATSSTSGSAKVCSRPLLSSSRTVSSIGLALLARELDAGAHAIGAPAVLAVVREQARVQFGIAGAADRAGAPGGEHLDLADVMVRPEAGHHRALAGRPAAPARAARPCRAPAPARASRAAGSRWPASRRGRTPAVRCVCSLKRSMRGKPVVGRKLPSTRRCV